MDGQPIEYDDNECDPRDWWCKIETKEEELVYDKAFHKPFNPASATKSLVQGTYTDLWNEMVKHAGQGMGVSWGDDDIYGYIRPDELEPEVGEEYTDSDGDIWVRVE
jgi:hypothetical protein